MGAFASILTALALTGLQSQTSLPMGAPQPAQPAEDADAVDPIIIEAQRRRTSEQQRKAESAFVRELSAPTVRRKLARWNDTVCPGVIGWPRVQATFVVDRIAQEARRVGLDVGDPGCTPNILILVTSEGDRTARLLQAKFRGLFPPRHNRGLYTAGGGQSRQEFVTESRPVRWWHISELKGSDGRPMQMVRLSDIVRGAPDVAVPVLENATASRLASATREDFALAVIVVDTTQTKGVTYEELASYLTMVSLAQLDPEAAPEELPTIMSLFNDRDRNAPRPGELTEWDRAYLRGLYKAPDNARNLHAQRGAIRHELSKVER